MTVLITLLYLAFLLVYALIAVFVLYHLRTYTVSHAMSAMFSLVFIAVTGILIFVNVSLFLAIPFAQFFSGSSLNTPSF